MHKRLVLLAALAASLVAVGPVAAGTHGLWLDAVAGRGSGIVNVTSMPGQAGLTVDITINVHGAPPNTTFLVQRAPETGPTRPLMHDGICQRAQGIYPWNDGTATFVTFPRPLAGDLKTLTTGATGAGTAHFVLNFPAVADGTVFDVEFRLISVTAPTTDLRTDCFTVTAR
jgi:hypothetical protein